MADKAEKKEPASHARRDLLLSLQAKAQATWNKEKLFESDAPVKDDGAGKFFGTFPYPYMNGLLHLGHAFSLSKLEFASAYHRLRGRRVLFPFAFHCTGMPIKSCADKLAREIGDYGLPPAFPPETEADDDAADKARAEAAEAAAAAKAEDPTKFKAKKGKAAAKSTGESRQWNIMTLSGYTDANEIARFRDPSHWLTHFPPLARRDVAAMGCGVDWRRSFITTDANPYYDAFVKWQMRALRAAGKIVKDKRLAVYSPRDGQPCADHDRASGEGVGPQEYVLIKLQVDAGGLKTGPLAVLAGHPAAAKGVFLAAATLRPETMYGQTNCWVLPEGKYGAFAMKGGEVFIMTQRAANNAAYQELCASAASGSPAPLASLKGTDLVGLAVRAPLAIHAVVYVLPMLSILTNKGTGIVTSVPSDSPDDYMALCDLKSKAPLRAKYGVKDEHVLPFDVVPVVSIPGYGDAAAPKVCADLKIKSQNDKVLLEEAKKLTYLKGFVEGVMCAGPHAGKKVSDAKPLIRAELVASGHAVLYSEPEKVVMSRSGEECVVALTDQWYLTYGEPEWRAATEACLGALDACHADTRAAFEHTLGWLRQWACSRSFGLGSTLPWDEQYLVESLSDSTAYMAYYTVAHLLQGGDMYGTAGVGAVPPSALTDAVWDYVFARTESPPSPCDVPGPLLAAMRREFDFWYPWDLRVSGKDLIQNHLTFSLYTHTALWPASKWPRAVRCNGHLLLNSEKMSKSTGNFKTLHEAVACYGADAMRLALADAGDAVDDANFVEETANAAILRLTKELTWIEEVLSPGAPHRDEGAVTFADRVFANAIDTAVVAAEAAYERMAFRDALKVGFYDLQLARDAWRAACGTAGLLRPLAARFVDVQSRLLAPVCPHTCEHIWRALLHRPGSVLTSGWPVASPPDVGLASQAAYLDDCIATWRRGIAKLEAPPRKARPGEAPPAAAPRVSAVAVYVSPLYVGWQAAVLRVLQGRYDAAANCFPGDVVAAAKASLAERPDAQDVAKAAMPFIKFKCDAAVAGAGASALALTLPFGEAEVLAQNAAAIERALGLATGGLAVHAASDPATAASPFAVRIAAAHPGAPAAVFDTETAPVVHVAPAAKPPAPDANVPRFPWWDERSFRG